MGKFIDAIVRRLQERYNYQPKGEQPKYGAEHLLSGRLASTINADDYDFDRVPPFPISVYLPKGDEKDPIKFRDAVSRALGQWAKDYPDLDGILRQSAQSILYQRGSGQPDALGVDIWTGIRSAYAHGKTDIARRGHGKPVEQPRLKATGTTYEVTIIPLIPKGYTPPGTGGVPAPGPGTPPI